MSGTSPLPSAEESGKGRPRRHRVAPKTLRQARENRRQLTPAETRLWAALRARGLGGLKFIKQMPFGPYIADFACRSVKLVVEVDGDSHAHRPAYDTRRSAYMARQGYRVIRFQNAEIMESLDWVLETIRQAAHARPSPDPSLEGRGAERAAPARRLSAAEEDASTSPLPSREGSGEGRRGRSRKGPAGKPRPL